MKKFFKALVLILFFITVLSGCNSDSNKEAKEGEKGGRCFEDKTCNDELRCIEGFCVDLGDMADYPDVDPADSVPDRESNDGEKPDDEASDDDENGENGNDNPDLIDECDIDVEVRSKEDLDSIVNCRVITGELIIEDTDLEEVVLPHLEEVWDYFEIFDNPKLKKISMPKLEYAGCIFAVEFNPVLTEIDFSELSYVSDNIVLSMNDSLKIISLPNFQKAGNTIYIDFNESLESIDAPMLESILEFLIIYKNASLQSFSFPMLESTLVLHIIRNSVLETFDMSSLVEALGITIAYNPNLPTEIAEALVKQVDEAGGVAGDNNEICENKDSTVKCSEDYDWDWEGDWDDNGGDGCMSDTYQCSGNLLYVCEDGAWKLSENCGEKGLTCKQGECV